MVLSFHSLALWIIWTKTASQYWYYHEQIWCCIPLVVVFFFFYLTQLHQSAAATAQPPPQDMVRGLMIEINAGGWGGTQLKSQSPTHGLYLSINAALSRTFNCAAGRPPPPTKGIICLPQITNWFFSCWEIESFRRKSFALLICALPGTCRLSVLFGEMWNSLY